MPFDISLSSVLALMVAMMGDVMVVLALCVSGVALLLTILGGSLNRFAEPLAGTIVLIAVTLAGLLAKANDPAMAGTVNGFTFKFSNLTAFLLLFLASMCVGATLFLAMLRRAVSR